MLWRTSKLTDYRIEATDGTIGRVADLLFEDDSWTVRWLVVDTGGWLTGRQVLLPTARLGPPDGESGRIPVELTRDMVKESPGAETDEPVSRQKEQALFRHYGWDPYWTTGLPDLAVAPGAIVPPPVPADPEGDALLDDAALPGDPHLQSARHVAGYHINATDDSIGHVQEFLVDDRDWAVRYMVVDTRNWWPGKHVLVSPRWIRDVNWGERNVHVGISRKAVEGSPEFDPEKLVDRPYEERLHEHYRMPAYWL